MSRPHFVVVSGAFIFACCVSGPAFGQGRAVRPVTPPFIGYTLLYGSGSIMVPHGFMQSGEWDLYLNAGTTFPEKAGERDLDEGLSLIYMWRGRVEAGLTAYSIEDYGITVKGVVLTPSQYRPSVSVGVLNLLGSSDIGRHGTRAAGEAYENYIERASPYAVASYVWYSSRLPVATALTLGWGAGHFLVDNPLYSSRGRSAGFFGSALVDYRAGAEATIRFAVEHDAWDTNLALSLSFRGAEVAIGVLALEEGGPEDDTLVLNQARPYFRIGGSLRNLRRWTETP